MELLLVDRKRLQLLVDHSQELLVLRLLDACEYALVGIQRLLVVAVPYPRIVDSHSVDRGSVESCVLVHPDLNASADGRVVSGRHNFRLFVRYLICRLGFRRWLWLSWLRRGRSRRCRNLLEHRTWMSSAWREHGPRLYHRRCSRHHWLRVRTHRRTPRCPCHRDSVGWCGHRRAVHQSRSGSNTVHRPAL